MRDRVGVVLGGTGFLGQRLCQSLLDAGFHVRSVSRSGSPKGKPEPWWSKVNWIAAPIGTESSTRALEGADFVFHLASTTLPSSSNADIVYDLESNAVATVQMLEAAALMRFQRFIFVSSGGTVYGLAHQTPIPESHATNPLCSYGVHKLAIEKYLHIFGALKELDSAVLRVSNMYGESQDCNRPLGAVAHFTARAVSGSPIEIWGDGMATRDYIHVQDVVDAILAVAFYEGRERLFNIGTGRGVSLNQLVDLLRQRISTPVTVNYLPHRGFDVPENILDIGRARRELSWTPKINLESGLERMIRAAQAALTRT
jgi:UDP-glucose 4-epimerase